MKLIHCLLAGLAGVAPIPASAANAGNEVVVVYNTRMPDSKSVAEYYARCRNVPTNQILGLALNPGLSISRTEFEDSLQKPLAKMLEERKLWRIRSEIIPGTNGKPARVEWRVKDSKIRYAVLCYGVPTRIAREPNLKEKEEEELQPELRRNEAAVDTELALLPAIEQRLPLTGPLRNLLYGATNVADFHPTNGVLMVTRLDGPSAEIARRLVDKALQAENEGLWGRVYIDVRNTSDPGYKAGDEVLRNAAAICRQLGFETTLDERPETFPPEFPASHIAFYAGWYDPAVSGPFARTNVEFMPGAFAYHLHSFSAADLRSPSQNWAGPLLARGATATMGCVDEPFLGGTPDIAVFASRFLFHGMTYGEAAYAAQPVLSWQTTIVGDPLYCPFRKPPHQLHEELERNHNHLVEWSHLRVVNMNQARGMPVTALALYLHQLDITKQSAVLTEKLADLYAAEGKPSSAIDATEQALKLDPSPQQRVRLRLALAERLLAADHNAEALDDYEALLSENPDYPNKLDLYGKLEALAQRLERKKAVAKYAELVRQLTPPASPATNKAN